MRLYPPRLVFDSKVEIQPGKQAILSAQPTRPFLGSKLVVDPKSKDFMVLGLNIGLFTQLIETIPAGVLIAKYYPVSLQLDACRTVYKVKILIL